MAILKCTKAALEEGNGVIFDLLVDNSDWLKVISKEVWMEDDLVTFEIVGGMFSHKNTEVNAWFGEDEEGYVTLCEVKEVYIDPNPDWFDEYREWLKRKLEHE